MLRDYQKDAVGAALDDLKESGSALIVAPTGSGKTEIMIEVIRELKGNKILVLLNRIKLVDQTRERFEHANIQCSVFCGSLGEKIVSQVTIASVHSWHVVEDEHFDLVILDEVHNFAEEKDTSRYYKCIERLKLRQTKILGFTATPFRAHGVIYGKGKTFPHVTHQIDIHALIAQNFLVKPVMKKPDNQMDTSNLRVVMGDWDQGDLDALVEDEAAAEKHVHEVMERAKEKKKIFWQCVNIQHCEMIASKIRSLYGQEAETVHSKLSYEERQKNLERFENGFSRHCVFVTILSEGYNYPPADCLVLLRPIRSPVLYVQTVGRVLRPFAGKMDALILDFGRVRETCGTLDKPNIRGKGERNREEKPTSWTCKECLTYNDLEDKICMNCGAPKPVEERKSKLATTADEGDLLEMSFKVNSHQITSVTFKPHKSKAGNDCIMAIYNLETELGKLFGDKQVVEFFVTSSPYSIPKFNRRCQALGINSEEIRREVVLENLRTSRNVISRRLLYQYDGKYNRVVGINPC